MKNRVVDIVGRERLLVVDAKRIDGSGKQEVKLLQQLAALAGIAVTCESAIPDRQGRIVLDVRFKDRRDPIRLAPKSSLFPPTELVAYFNAQLADRQTRLICCNDSKTEAIAFANPTEAAELRAAMFAIVDDIAWPASNVRTSREAELLAEIRSAPHDNAPRLAFAEWLADRDSPRAKVIQMQCNDDSSGQNRARFMIDKHYAAWTAHIPAWASCPAFERGFVQSVVVADLATFLAHHRELLELTPIPDVELEGFADKITMSSDGRFAIQRQIGWADPRLVRPTIPVGAHIYAVIELSTGKVVLEHRLPSQRDNELFTYGFTPDSRGIWFERPGVPRKTIQLKL